MFRLLLACSLLPSLVPMTGGEEPAKGLDVRMVPPDGDGGKYWPRWRGPSGQGLAGPGKYPETWSNSENVLWKIDLPGAGNSSPIIWKNQLFLTTAYEQGKRRSILCFDIHEKGKKLWESFVPAGVPEGTQAKNGWASATPSTDGERIYAYFGNHGLLCVDFAGKQVWHKSYPDMDAYHGTSCSPLLYKDRVIVFQDHRSPWGSFAAAYGKKTGQELWKVARKEKVGWGSPIAIQAGDHDEIIVSSEYKVYAYDPANGNVLWTCGGNLVEVTPTPAVGHGLLYCCSGRVGPTLAIKPGGKGDVSKTNVVWSVNTGSPFIPSPLVYGDYLYTVNDILSVGRCFDAKTGKVMWQERLGPVTKHGFSASPIGVDNKVFFTNDQGDTFVLAAEPEFKLLHVNKLNATTLASPALLDGKWYFRTDKQLLCIGMKKG